MSHDHTDKFSQFSTCIIVVQQIKKIEKEVNNQITLKNEY